MFNTEKNGYSKKEVDNFIIKQKAELNATISDLRTQNIELKAEIEELTAELKSYKLKEDSIKDAMILAAKKNKEIEEQASREYRIECEKVKKLYYKWADTIEAVHKKYGLINTDELNTRKFYLDIENLFDSNINSQPPVYNNYESQPIEKKENSSVDEQKIYHKELLSRMSGLLHSVSSSVRKAELNKHASYQIDNQQKQTNVETEPKREVQKTEFVANEFAKETERLSKIEKKNESSAPKDSKEYKPLVPKSEGLQGFANLLDKYLSTDDDGDMGAYEKVITNSGEKEDKTHSVKETTINNQTETENKHDDLSKVFNFPQGDLAHGTNGFNLQEAVNPQQSLEEIMQAFDL